MDKKFNITEILESVGSINHDNSHNSDTKKKIDIKSNPETEKIINDAEKSIEDFEIDINNKMEKVNPAQTLNVKNKSGTLIVGNGSDTLILDNEFVEGKNNDLVENNLKELELEEENNELVENNPEELEEENNLKDLESNFVYINEKLKNENIKKEEKIKDQTVLLDTFLNKKKHSDLYKNIKLYQEDNALLRKKILQLSDNETSLRLQISNLDLDKQIKEKKEEKPKQSTKTEKLDIKELNIKIEDFSQKINQMATELLKLRKSTVD